MDALERQGWIKRVDKPNGKSYKLHSMNISIWHEKFTNTTSMGGWFGEENQHLSYGIETLEAVLEVMKDMQREQAVEKICKNCIHRYKDTLECGLHGKKILADYTCDDWLGW